MPSQAGRGTQIARFGAPADGYLDDQPADHIGGSRTRTSKAVVPLTVVTQARIALTIG